MVDTKTLNIKIKASGYKRRVLARMIGISDNSLRNKVQGQTQFRLDEAERLAKLLGMSDQTFLQIFFGRGPQNG